LNKRILTGILIAIVGCGLVAFGIFITGRLFTQRLAPLPPPTQEPGETESVVVAMHNVTLGTVLKPEDLRIAEVPITLAPEGALDTIDAAVGKFARVDLTTGEILLSQKLADPTNVSHDLSFILQEDQVLMAFPASDLMSSINLIQRGDLVDILASIEADTSPQTPALDQTANQKTQETGKQTYTFDALQRVQVTAMIVDIITENSNVSNPVEKGSTAESRNAQNKVRAYLLALNPQDALVIKHLKDIGAEFDIVLRAPNSNQLFDVNAVTSDYLIDRYQLVKP
jgi:pilus assembly protein CpaB